MSLSEVVQSGTRFARFEVTDDGGGMDSETLDQLFVPFFTTKQMGNGTGLGMSTVYELVSKAEGQIKAQSSLGNGTTIEMLFPVVNDISPEAERREVDERDERGTGTAQEHVLVVEDDAQVAVFIRRVLSQEGFRVTDAKNGVEALELLNEELPDLILTDVIMSKMSGPAMVAQMRSLGIEVSVVFMSGYADDRLDAHGFAPGKVSLVRKPFRPARLVNALKTALESSSRGKAI